jgi:hypothetical protein
MAPTAPNKEGYCMYGIYRVMIVDARTRGRSWYMAAAKTNLDLRLRVLSFFIKAQRGVACICAALVLFGFIKLEWQSSYKNVIPRGP